MKSKPDEILVVGIIIIIFFLKMPFYISFNDTTLSNFRQILIKNTFEPANSPTLRHFFSACAPELNQISFLYQTYFLYQILF